MPDLQISTLSDGTDTDTADVLFTNALRAFGLWTGLDDVLRDSLGVSSLSDDGTGENTVSLINAMQDVDFFAETMEYIGDNGLNVTLLENETAFDFETRTGAYQNGGTNQNRDANETGFTMYGVLG